MCLSSAAQAILVLQLLTKALCQFPMPFPFPQMGGMPPPGMPNMAPMAPVPPLAPPQMFNQPMPMTFQMPGQQKMPSVVMPFYPKNSDKKKHRKRKRKPKSRRSYTPSWESDTDVSGSSSGEFVDFRKSGAKKRRQVLTPVVSYVTKDGYVVYQKKIKKDKAKDWLEMTKKLKDSTQEFTSAEEKKFQDMLKYKKKKLNKHH